MDSSFDRVLITGGEGFIGHHLTAALADQGLEIHSLGNLFAGSKDLLSRSVTFHEQDIRDADLTQTISDINPDAVIHLAAVHYVPFCRENPGVAWDTNVMGTRNLLESLSQTDVQRFMFASSGAVYTPDETPHHEKASTRPTDAYGKSKLIGEDLVNLHAGQTFSTGICARLFNVYGPGETNPHLIPEILDQLREGGVVELGNLSPERDFIYMDDVVRAFIRLLEAPVDGFRTYNVGTGESHSVRTVAETLLQLTNVDGEIKQEEGRVRESDRPRLCADIGRIREEVGWTPRYSLEEGLERLVDAEF